MCHAKDPGRRAIRIARRRAEFEQSSRSVASPGLWSSGTPVSPSGPGVLAAPWDADPGDPEMVAEATRTLVAEGWRFPPELAAWRARRGLSIPEAARPVIKPGQC